MIRATPFLVTFLALGPMAARAQGAVDNQDSRFSFYRTDAGFLRLDGTSGQVSMCTRRPVGWACEPLPEERTAYETEITRLQADNASLKKELLAHNVALPAGMRPETGEAPDGRLRLLSRGDREVHRVIELIGGAWRRLVEMVASVQKDLLDKS